MLVKKGLQYKFLNFSLKSHFDQYYIRPKRHFMLTLNFITDFEPTQNNINHHTKLINEYEETNKIILGMKSIDYQSETLIFHSQDELTPFEFLKRTVYYKENLIDNYEIKELELVPRKRYNEIEVYYKYR